MIGAGLLEAAGELIAEVCPAHRYAVVADQKVADLYGDTLRASMDATGLESIQLRIRAGESSKTRESWARLCDEMAAAGIGRDGVVIALGGGVAGDLAGFVAATYMRGLPLVQMPTTLLAMVDSSVGGKTGVDTPAGKNLIGVFHQPRLVLIDPQTLTTLPDRELTAGLPEAFKHGLILDAGYFGWLEREVDGVFGRRPEIIARLVERSVEIKARVVAVDERETGYRRILNFGHTVGHALEAARQYAGTHGEAVAVGLAAEARIGERLGITQGGVAERIRAALTAARLPAAAGPDLDRERFLAALGSDKKRQRGEDRVVLLRSVGQVAGSAASGWTHRVDRELFEEAVFGGGGGV